jgi:hypothetical protein
MKQVFIKIHLPATYGHQSCIHHGHILHLQHHVGPQTAKCISVLLVLHHHSMSRLLILENNNPCLTFNRVLSITDLFHGCHCCVH